MPDPDWLKALRADLTRLTTEAARVHWPGPTPEAPPYYNYRLEHVRQVERSATKLLAAVGGDRDIVLASVWIHDRFQPQFVGPRHAERAAEWARANLGSYGFPLEKVERVSFAVARHSDPPGMLAPGAHEARLLWDADKLCKLGVLELVAIVAAMPAFPQRAVDLVILAEALERELPDARRLAAQFYFEIARAWAAEKVALQEAIFRALERELK